jgi:hypothetical protein
MMDLAGLFRHWKTEETRQQPRFAGTLLSKSAIFGSNAGREELSRVRGERLSGHPPRPAKHSAHKVRQIGETLDFSLYKGSSHHRKGDFPLRTGWGETLGGFGRDAWYGKRGDDPGRKGNQREREGQQNYLHAEAARRTKHLCISSGREDLNPCTPVKCATVLRYASSGYRGTGTNWSTAHRTSEPPSRNHQSSHLPYWKTIDP